MAKEVAKKEGSAIQAFDPSMFEEDAGRGMENMGQEDLALPFLMKRHVRVISIILCLVTCIPVRRVFGLFHVPINVGLFSGRHEALGEAHLLQSLHRPTIFLKRNGLLMTTKNML